MRRLLVIFDALPENARSKRQDPDVPTWGMQEELLAQVVEEVSVLASNRQRKEPRRLPRPFDKKGTPGRHRTASGGSVSTGLAAMLDATVRAGAVRR